MPEDQELTDTDWRTLCDTLRARSLCSTCCSPNAATAARRRAWWVMRVDGVRRFSKRSRRACDADRKLGLASTEDWALVIKNRDRRDRHPTRQREDLRLSSTFELTPVRRASWDEQSFASVASRNLTSPMVSMGRGSSYLPGHGRRMLTPRAWGVPTIWPVHCREVTLRVSAD